MTDASDDTTGRGERSSIRSPGNRPAPGFVVVMVLLLVVATLVGISLGRSHTNQRSTISVSGTGTVKGTPDTATFNIGVHTTSPTANAALGANNAKVKALIAALLKNGVLKKEMQTSGLNIYQNTNNSGVVTGFSVDNTLNVTMHNVSQSGAAIDAAATAVGNGIQLNGISFSISNQSALIAQARTRAMKSAKRTADQLASAGGVRVNAIVSITDQESQSPPIFYGMDATSPAVKMSSVPVQTGTQTVTVQVAVVYSLG